MSLGLGLRLGLEGEVEVWVRFEIGVRARIAFFLICALACKYAQPFSMMGFYGLLAGNKARTEVFVSHHPHTVTRLCNPFDHVFAVLIFMPRFKSINLYQTRPKIKLLLQNNGKNLCADGFASRPPIASGG